MDDVRIGDVRMSYLIQPCGLNGQPINGGNHYANADSPEDARATALRMLRAEPNCLGYALGSVDVYGREMEFRGTGWVDLRGGQHDSFVVTREDAEVPPLPLTEETHCWDTTVMDYFETVHAMYTNGSCQCGDPTRNVWR